MVLSRILALLRLLGMPKEYLMLTYTVNVGDPMPAFKIKDSEGYELTNADLIGSPVVLYFYPKDDTPGCTKEACAFRDNMGRLDEFDALVIGVSPDTQNSHDQFARKFNLNFTLLADDDMELCNKFDIHKGVVGIERTTFVIDGNGIIRWIERPVSVSEHVERVIGALKQITEA